MTKASFYNFHKWPEDKTLFVIGAPGAGKTTLAKRISEFDYSKAIHIDDLLNNLKELTKQEKGKALMKYFSKLNNTTVIEGVTLLYIDHEWLKERPFILLESSNLRRIYRFTKRESKYGGKSIPYAFFHSIRLCLKWNKEVQSFKKSLSGKKHYKLSLIEINTGTLPSKESILGNPGSPKYTKFVL